MTASSNPGPRRPVFVDDVDRSVECIDSDPREADPPADGVAAQERRPLLTDVVDRLLEVADSAADETAPGAADGPRPLFIDDVDRVVEFADEAEDAPGPEAPPAHQSEGIAFSAVDNPPLK